MSPRGGVPPAPDNIGNMNGSTADCDQFGMINASAAGNQITSFLCPSDTDLANLTYFIYYQGGPLQLVGRFNYPSNCGTNVFRGASGVNTGVVYVPRPREAWLTTRVPARLS